MVTFLSPGKRKKSPRTPVFPRDKEEERKGKGRRKGCLGIRFLRGIQGKKDGRKEGKRKERMLFFSLSGGAFLSPEKERNPVVSREEEWKEAREKR